MAQPITLAARNRFSQQPVTPVSNAALGHQPASAEQSAVVGVLDSDSRWSKALCQALELDGYRVRRFDNPGQLMMSVKHDGPNLVLLEESGRDGVVDAGHAWVRRVRAYSTAPIILMGPDDDAATVRGLDAGADDYVAKPVSHEVLVARVRAHLRRVGMNKPRLPKVRRSSASINGVKVDLDVPSLQGLDGTRIMLTDCEFAIIQVLLDCANQVASRERLFADVFGTQWDPRDRRVDLHVAHLRRKLGEAGLDPVPLITVRGRGYQLEGVIRFD